MPVTDSNCVHSLHLTFGDVRSDNTAALAVLAQNVQMCQSDVRIVQSRHVLIMKHSSPATQHVRHVRP